MQLQLPPHLDEMVREKVASGEYPDAADVVAEALELLRERDDRRRLRESIRDGFEQVARGEGIPYTPELRAEIRAAAMRELDTLEKLRAAAQLGLDQADRGELIRYTPELHDRIIESARERWRAGDKPGPDVVP